MQEISVIVLTYNEELHIERCINSLSSVVKNIFVVDSFSSDNTIEICERMGAKVFQNSWINYANQFQWGLDNCPIDTEWVMRMDADEYLTPELKLELQSKLCLIQPKVTGVYFKRRVYFMGRWIKHGGFYPTKLLRLWKFRYGKIEQRWMDEHIKLSEGLTIEFNSDIVDENLNNLSWWTAKHNSYSTREAVDVLSKKYNFQIIESIDRNKNTQDSQRRKYKDSFYLRTPLFVRAFLYYFFRYIIKLGFLDGKAGFVWHFLQAFWYRMLVDAKIFQIEYLAATLNKSISEVIEEEYNFKL